MAIAVKTMTILSTKAACRTQYPSENIQSNKLISSQPVQQLWLDFTHY